MNEADCNNCMYKNKLPYVEPCVTCVHNGGGLENFVGETDDPVNHPAHYTKGKIEVADFIADQKLNFDRGNAVKYVCRAGIKDPEKEIQDLEKAIWYINHEIKNLKGELNNGTAENIT